MEFIMKKITAILLTTALLMTLTGCNNAEGNSESAPDPVGQSSPTAPSQPESSGDSAPESSDSSESSESVSDVPEKRQPDGEPTFLKGLDGKPIYTSEITQITAYDLEKREEIPTDKLDPENFSALCEGFTYVYIPRPSVDFMANPELFEMSEDGKYHYYIGEELPDSYEFTRVNVGDKIGGLTVKSASSYFKPSGYEGSEQYYAHGNIEFEGELELTGFVIVDEEHELYPGTGGNTFFYPDSASSVKIPRAQFDLDLENDKARHYVSSVENSFYGWYGDGGSLFLGNIADFDSELREGDMYVKVRVAVGDITWDSGSLGAAVRKIELI